MIRQSHDQATEEFGFILRHQLPLFIRTALATTVEQGPDERQRHNQEDCEYDREFHAIFRFLK